jgi:hypothetical protein
MCKQNSAAEGGRLSSARARLSGPAGWAVGCRSATCNRDEAAGLCGHARQRHARQGAAPHPAEPMPPRPGHCVALSAGAAAAHSQSVPVSRPSFMPLAQDSSARSAREGGGGAARQPRGEVARAGWQAGAGTRWSRASEEPACAGHHLLLRVQPVGLTFALVGGSAQECNGRGERQRERHPHGAGLRFCARGGGFRGQHQAAVGQELELAQAGAAPSSSSSTMAREGGLLR